MNSKKLNSIFNILFFSRHFFFLLRKISLFQNTQKNGGKKINFTNEGGPFIDTPQTQDNSVQKLQKPALKILKKKTQFQSCTINSISIFQQN
jgi:hypothetical protein